MKLFFFFLILIFTNSCSFDTKSGIWKNESNLAKKVENTKSEKFIELNNLLLNEEIFSKTINLENNYSFKLSKPIKNSEWNDMYYKNTNNFDNLEYNNFDKQIAKSRKLTGNKSNEFIFIKKDILFLTDQKGNIITYSNTENRLLNKFNFYKKQFKNYKKKLNLFIDNNKIYVSDNMGYLYSYDYKLNKILWAKNYKIPFRSNIKISKNKIFASNQNNDLLIFDKNSGEILKKIPTEPTIIQNNFVNNIALDNVKTLFFLNSYGSLYAIDLEFLEVKWFINLNKSIDLNPSNQFSGNPIIYQKNKIIISSNFQSYIIDSNTGSILNKKNFSSYLKPIINNNYLFLITKKNLLVSVDLRNNKILYSYNIDQQIAEFLKIKKETVSLKSLMLVNNNLFVFLNNSYILNFNIKGKLQEIKKLNSEVNSQPIFIDGSLIYLDQKNRLTIVN